MSSIAYSSTYAPATLPSQEQALSIIDYMNQAKRLQQNVRSASHKHYAEDLFKQCHQWLQQHHIPFYYDSREQRYLLNVWQYAGLISEACFGTRQPIPNSTQALFPTVSAHTALLHAS
ncbi:hypothetical protein EPA93_29515 [Ktedonosporobacter rubrisoli]|uniref:Uncharacterized protein n=1 Tax=Ktedonosporobacter rubrisoli TaxID=2509675 RepID=A0A4P6JWQ0_KTERU|nr:hypothetical protein [Ktedonosporobacter rubrisoli]QBD79895.1 hypothetical protein EPA93_29515 [Ktedonosporobacter rubrisoli]